MGWGLAGDEPKLSSFKHVLGHEESWSGKGCDKEKNGRAITQLGPRVWPGEFFYFEQSRTLTLGLNPMEITRKLSLSNVIKLRGKRPNSYSHLLQ